MKNTSLLNTADVVPDVPAAAASPTPNRIVAWVVAFALFMETLDATIINTAIPQIARSMGESPIELKAALICYLLSLAIFIPISGWAADRFGARSVFGNAILVFTLGSICCGLSPNLYALAASRCLQGIGGAMMMPVGRLILLRSFPKSELVRATNYATIPALIGPALGPVVGGAIATYVSWRWAFFINVPFGIMGWYVVRKFIGNARTPGTGELDFVGFVLFGTGLAGVSFAIESVRETHLSSFLETVLIIASATCLVAYAVHAQRHKKPLLDIHIFDVRTFRLAIWGGLVSRMGIGGMPFLLPLLLQVALGYTPLQAGLLVSPLALAMLVMKFFVSDILKRFGFRQTLVVNTAVLGLSVMPFALVGPTTPMPVIVGIVLVHGLLSSLQFSCLNVLSYVDVEAPRFSMATSIGSAMIQLSMSLGIGVTAVFITYFSKRLGGEGLLSQVAPFHATFLCMGGMTLLSTLIFKRLRPNDGEAASGHQAPPLSEALAH